MEITGRLTRDAEVVTLKDKRKVVNFSIAVNDYYKTRSGEEQTLTEFVRCSYWISTKVAAFLTKGTLVELFGRMSAQAWNDAEGEARASLNFHTSNIKLLAGTTKNGNPSKKGADKDKPPF